MTYKEALDIVESEFETRYVAPDGQAIRVNLTYDGVNGFYIELYDNDGEALLTDGGITKDIFYKVVDEAEWRALSEAHGFAFNHWNIERPFTSIADVYDFIDFLMVVADKYNPLTE